MPAGGASEEDDTLSERGEEAGGKLCYSDLWRVGSRTGGLLSVLPGFSFSVAPTVTSRKLYSLFITLSFGLS